VRERLKSPCVEILGIEGDLVACRLPAGAAWHVADSGVDTIEPFRKYHV
jgi:hypothetical protein